MKICYICKTEKELSEFGLLKSSKDGHRYDCKDCRKIQNAQNKEKKTEYNKKYYSLNKDHIDEQNKEYREINSVEINIQRKEYRAQNREHIALKNKEYLPIRKEKIKERRKTDLSFKISEVYKSKLHRAIKKNKFTYSQMLNCSIDNFIKWIEFQFDETMSWENHGVLWHIDHILPINCFDFTDEKQRNMCFNWKNMQPLEGLENRLKSDNIEIAYVAKQVDNLKKFENTMEATKTLNEEYQGLKETLIWLREKLRYGNNFQNEELILIELISEIGNPQPSSNV